MKKKLLDFTGVKVSEIKQINPLFSTCKARILYTGKNRNMSSIDRKAVESSLPSLVGIPIVGEYTTDTNDFKGHGGKIDLDSFDFIHTTKPYGFIPHTAEVEWETVKGRDGVSRDYLTVDGCYLWTGRYPEAVDVIEKGKGQSMEIEVTDGEWNEYEETYEIKSFVFSALCILGDEVEPAFEDANITANFTAEKFEAFKLEYTQMMNEAKSTLFKEEENKMNKLKKLIEKYSTSMEELTSKGLNFEEISEDQLEDAVAQALEVEKIEDENPTGGTKDEPDDQDTGDENPQVTDEEDQPKEDIAMLQQEVLKLKADLDSANAELNSLREFKLNKEKEDHEKEVQKIFSNFQLKEDEVKDIDIHSMNLEQIEEKCYSIIGKKLTSKKGFSKLDNSQAIKLPLNQNLNDDYKNEYGGLFNKFNNQ